MSKDVHFTRFENPYLSAPVNEFYQPGIQVSEAKATVEISQKLFHTAGA